MQVVVAAFDVDHTLTVRDCVVPFMQKVAGRWGFIRACLSSPFSMANMVIRRDRDGIKSFFVREIFEGKSLNAVHDLGVEFADLIVSGWMREDVAERLRWHQEQGHVVVLVSASLQPYLEPFGDMCEVDAVLCTQLEVDDDRYTGRIVGKNCRGEEKVQRLRLFLESAGLPFDSLKYAYGDSNGDMPMLRAATEGYMVASDEWELMSA